MLHYIEAPQSEVFVGVLGRDVLTLRSAPEAYRLFSVGCPLVIGCQRVIRKENGSTNCA